ncbi:MAG: hypothetical protein MZV64_47460 [Ignavibacteriales bacterium]|nr:hypothetical protein [Ignavibacteriales bacterium]
MLAVLVIGRQISGSKKLACDLGPLGFQPSEIAKIATSAWQLSAYLSRNNSNIDSFKDILITLGIGFTPVLLILT